MRKRRLLPLAIIAVGLLGFAWVSPKIPHDQEIEIALGDRAPAVNDLHVRYRQSDETQREVVFHYAGGAPAVVRHAPRLPDGDYVVDIETEGSGGNATVARRVTLKDGTVTTIHAEAP